MVPDEEEEAKKPNWDLRKQIWAVQMYMVTVLSIILETSTLTVFQYPMVISTSLRPEDINFFKSGSRVDCVPALPNARWRDMCRTAIAHFISMSM